MSRVKQVETTVSEADLEPLAPPPLNKIERVCTGQQLIDCVELMAVEVGCQLTSIDHGGTKPPDNDPRGGISNTGCVNQAESAA